MTFYNKRFLKVLKESLELLEQFEDGIKKSLITLAESYRESLLSEVLLPLIEYATLYEGVMSFDRYVRYFYPYFKKDDPKERDDFLDMVSENFRNSPYWTISDSIK